MPANQRQEEADLEDGQSAAERLDGRVAPRVDGVGEQRQQDSVVHAGLSRRAPPGAASIWRISIPQHRTLWPDLCASAHVRTVAAATFRRGVRQLLPGRHQPEIRQVAQGQFRPGRRIDDEELHRPVAGVQRRVEAAFRHVDRCSRGRPSASTGLPFSSSTICSPLPEMTKMISSAPGWLWRVWPWPVGRSTTPPEKRFGAVDLRRDRQRQPAPVEAEGVDVLRIDEICSSLIDCSSSVSSRIRCRLLPMAAP